MKINPRSIRLFTLLKLPLVYFSGVRVVRIEENSVEVRVRHRWINQNPFRSMFWAVQGMAAELASGVLLMRKVNDHDMPISMLLIETKASFSKKAKGKITFNCNEGESAHNLVEKAIVTKQGQSQWFVCVGVDESGDEVSRFNFHWSVRCKA